MFLVSESTLYCWRPLRARVEDVFNSGGFREIEAPIPSTIWGTATFETSKSRVSYFFDYQKLAC